MDEITVCLGQSDRGLTIWKCCCGLVVYGGIDALEQHQQTCGETAIRLTTPLQADAEQQVAGDDQACATETAS